MNVYDETTGELLAEPDLSAGYTYASQRLVAHHEAVEEQFHFAVMPGTESMNNGKGLKGKVIDTPEQDAYDEYEDCLLYHKYTDDELEAKNKPSMEERLAAAEAALIELANMIGGEN